MVATARVHNDELRLLLVPLLPQPQAIAGRSNESYHGVRAPDIPHCPPDVEEIAEAYCMETLDRPASLAFENHYLVCARCSSVVASTDEYVRSMRNALRRLRTEEKDSIITRRTGTR